MNLYLDDDTADRRLVALLMNAGHRVTVPRDVDLGGSADPRHLLYAIEEQLVLVTRNHDDFLDLHEVIQAAGGSHPGLLIIRSDNDPKRDMTPRGIVTAMAKLEASGVPIRNEVYILNHWR
jgi:predicted nuclease of predicted toxin-antitoxin system